jgi:hypothetical protein
MAFIGNTPTTQAFTPAIDYFSGNGSTTAFTLSRPVASAAQVQVTIDNVAQNPSSAYTVSSNTITFTSAPLNGTNNIYVYYTSPITQVIAPGQGTVTATSMASSTGTGAGVFQTSPTITTPTIDTITSAASTALTLKSAGTTAITVDTSQNATFAGSVKTNTLTSAASTALTLQSAGTTAITVDTSQNVGIGTASPSTYANSYAPVLVTGTGSNFATIQARSDGPSGYGNGVSYGGSYSTNPINGARMWIGAAGGSGQRGGILFFTKDTDDNTNQPAERMRITSAGVVGINTTRATARLCIDAGCESDYTGLAIKDTDASTGGSIVAFTNSTNNSIGSISHNATNTVAYNTSSDYRMKEDVQPMTGALNKVALLKPVTYKWREEFGGGDGQGFIAHELQEVVPDCVHGTKDAVDADGNPKYQGIDTSFLVATLTAAIQELKAINDTQAETINALTARIVALENR